jgi:hypothetical protein
MYTRLERPMSPVEREALEGRLRQTREGLRDAVFKVVLLGLFDGVAAAAAVMAVLGKDRSGPLGVTLGLVAFLLANFYLLALAVALAEEWPLYRKQRAAWQDGVAVVEQVEAVALTVVVGCEAQDASAPAGQTWGVFDVGGGRLLARGWDEAPGTPACFEVVSTRAHRLRLGVTRRGTASLSHAPRASLALLVPDAARRARLAERLDASPLFSGTLEHLAEALGRLLEAPAGVAQDAGSAGERWSALQVEVEERFGVCFGPGGLIAEAASIAEARAGPVRGRDLLGVVLRRLPEGAVDQVRPLRPAFFRLRAALVAECGLARGAVRPSARLEDLVCCEGRADRWARLARRLGQPLPELRQGGLPVVAGVVLAAGLGLLYAVGVPAVRTIDGASQAHGFATAWWFLGLVACCVPVVFVGGIALLSALVAWLFGSWRSLGFPAECTTVADLTRHLAEGGGDRVVVAWAEGSAWLALRRLLAEHTGRRPMEVTPDGGVFDCRP